MAAFRERRHEAGLYIAVRPTADLECDCVDVVLPALALDNAADEVLLTSLKFEAEKLGDFAMEEVNVGARVDESKIGDFLPFMLYCNTNDRPLDLIGQPCVRELS
jgi:hypothetical protein